MINLKDDNGKTLPKCTQNKMDAYIKRIKAIEWFQPENGLDKPKIEKQVKFALECFGVKAKIEYRKLETKKDWDAAWGSAWDAAWGSARDAAWGAAWDAARGAAWGAADVLALEINAYRKKYPKGNFVNLLPLWELGLYPVGVVKGKFIIYVPKK